MRLTIAYSKIKKRNLVLINNATYQRETLSERPIRQPLSKHYFFEESRTMEIWGGGALTLEGSTWMCDVLPSNPPFQAIF